MGLRSRGGNTWTLGGRYRFTFVRTGDGWLINGCTIVISWADGNQHVFDLAHQLSADPS